MNLRIIVLYERNQYCITPFTHINPPRLQTHLSTESLSVVAGVGGGAKWAERMTMDMRNLLRG